MGTLHRQRLSDAEIVRRYRDDGESRGMIGLRAKISDAQVTTILIRAGVRIRGPNEALRLAITQRKARAG
jgi:hypothetical protein